MARTNVKTRDYRKDETARTAGGYGPYAAAQSPEALLRRAVLANLLWEKLFYESGSTVADEIKRLVPLIEPEIVARIAIEAREQQKLRHVPLFLLRECARLESHRGIVADTLPQVIQRADELAEFVAMYDPAYSDPKARKKQPLASGVKRGLAKAFQRFNDYHLGKYDRATAVRLRDVMFLVHAKPTQRQAEWFKQLAEGTLPVPDTWEVSLSRGADKKATWERLISERKLGGLAFLRNLRNMDEAKVDVKVVRDGFRNLHSDRLLPLDFLKAARIMPRWQPELEDAMLRSLGEFPKLKGESVLLIDVSGSMGGKISAKSDFDRLDCAAALAIMAREMCEHVTIWATAGDDYARKHRTQELPPHRGFALMGKVHEAQSILGGGGIFTRQALDYVKAQLGERETERTMIFTDSQDCDHPDSRVPSPFSPRNYLVDVSAHTRGVAYDGIWTAEISGWSEKFLPYVQALELQ